MGRKHGLPHRGLETNTNKQTTLIKFLPNSVKLKFKSWEKDKVESAFNERSKELLKNKKYSQRKKVSFHPFKWVFFLETTVSSLKIAKGNVA